MTETHRALVTELACLAMQIHEEKRTELLEELAYIKAGFCEPKHING